MADDSQVLREALVQDTGNPVLDSLVNIICAGRSQLSGMESLHERLLKLAEKEPGGLRVRIQGGRLEQVDTAANQT